MNILNKCFYWLKEFWQRKTILFSLLRVFVLLTIALPLIYFSLIRTEVIPDSYISGILKYFPHKCQEVTSPYAPPSIYCYTMFDKKYWSIEKWSTVREPLNHNIPPPGHSGTMEYPSM